MGLRDSGWVDIIPYNWVKTAFKRKIILSIDLWFSKLRSVSLSSVFRPSDNFVKIYTE